MEPFSVCDRRDFSQGRKDDLRTLPSYTIREVEDGETIEVELPGVAREDLVVEVKDRDLTVTGRRIPSSEVTATPRKSPEENISEKMASNDGMGQENTRSTVSYKVSFRLPEKADMDQVRGDLKNGLLTLRVPRKEAEKHSIEISN